MTVEVFLHTKGVKSRLGRISIEMYSEKIIKFDKLQDAKFAGEQEQD